VRCTAVIPAYNESTRILGVLNILVQAGNVSEIIVVNDASSDDTANVARQFAKGGDAMLKKVGEEATEVVMAAKDGDAATLTAEVADLWFHTMIVLAAHGLRPGDVLAELRRREGLSGLEEFAARRLRERESEEVRDEPSAGHARDAAAAG
jgi:phosphoribosyl-ATP pyrophosphohydrolase